MTSLGYELSRCTDAHEHYVLRILWDSHDGHLKGFRTSEEFKPFFAAVKPFTVGIEEMPPYDLKIGVPSDPEFRSALVAYLEWGTRLAVINSTPGAEIHRRRVRARG